MRKFNYKASVISVLLCMCIAFSSGCKDDGGNSSGTGTANSTGGSSALYPIATLPEELKNNTTDEIDVVGTAVSSNKELDFDKANEIIGNNTFNVYYDNSMGCYMEYVKQNVNSDMMDVFQKTMRSFRSAFDCSQSYKSFTTQPDTKSKTLRWKELANGGNIFDDYANMDIYTGSPSMMGYDYAPDKSPIVMWLDIIKANVEKGEDADSAISVYMSDLNENNGALATAGTTVKKILNTNPESQLDFLIISYVLPYTGSISGYSIDKDGNSKDKDVTYTVSGTADRYYYALAFGSHETLAMFDYKVKQGMNELEEKYNRKLNVKSYMYRDIFYDEQETLTYDMHDNVINDPDFMQNTPVSFVLNDGKGNAAKSIPDPADKKSDEKTDEKADETPKSEDKTDDIFGELKNEYSAEPNLLLANDMFGESASTGAGGDDVFGEGNSDKQVLKNLEMIKEDELSQYIDESASGETYSLKYVLPTSGNAWQCAVAVNNSEIYELDTEKAVSYVYVPESDKNDVMAAGDAESGWLSGGSVSERGISVKASQDNIIVGSNDMLDSSKIAVAASIPVIFKYKQVVTIYEIKKVDQEFIDWVNGCNAPEKTEKGKEYEQLTHTAFFDEFMDKITDGYKNISDTGKRKAINTEPKEFAATVDRVNIIIVADPKTCNGM